MFRPGCRIAASNRYFRAGYSDLSTIAARRQPAQPTPPPGSRFGCPSKQQPGTRFFGLLPVSELGFRLAGDWVDFPASRSSPRPAQDRPRIASPKRGSIPNQAPPVVW